MKKTSRILLAILAIAILSILVACKEEEEAEDPIVSTQNTTSDAHDYLYVILKTYGYKGTLDDLKTELGGKSAYQIALENGFDGTENDWLLSLKGDDGKDGAAGSDGRSTFWFTGHGEPDLPNALLSDLYLDLDTADVYLFDGTAWEAIANITTVGKSVSSQTHTVTLHVDDRSEAQTLTVRHGECLSLPIPEKAGQVFLGWFTGKTAVDQKVTSYTPIATDMDLYAEFEKITEYTETFTIRYFYQDSLYEEQTYAEGQTIVPPTVANDDFISWGELPSYMPARDLTVYAKTEGYCVVKFATTDEREIAVVRVKQGESALPPSYIPPQGYLFERWEGNYENVTEDTTVYAVCVKQSFTVRFIDYDQTVLKEEKVEYGKNATAPTPPSREGYTFEGWSGNYSPVTASVDVRAIYSALGSLQIIDGSLRYADGTPVTLSDRLDSELCSDVFVDLKNDLADLLQSDDLSLDVEYKDLHLYDCTKEGLPVIYKETRCFVSIEFAHE